MDPITAALCMGAAAGIRATASRAVTDAYDALRTKLIRRFPSLDPSGLQGDPGSLAAQDEFSGRVKASGADTDEELRRLSEQLVEQLVSTDPGVAQAVAVEVTRVQSGHLTIQRVAGSVRVTDVSTTDGGITITDVQGSPRDPNL